MKDKNFYVSVTYPQYYWKVSIALRGCLEKFLTVRLLQLETFTVKLRVFRKRKMPLTYIGNLTVGFTRILSIFLDKKMEPLIGNRNIKRKSD